MLIESAQEVSIRFRPMARFLHLIVMQFGRLFGTLLITLGIILLAMQFFFVTKPQQDVRVRPQPARFPPNIARIRGPASRVARRYLRDS